jgi:hypothetical protein
MIGVWPGSARGPAGPSSGPWPRSSSGSGWSAICPLAYIYLAVTIATHRLTDTDPASGVAALVPITIPELLRLLRDAVIPPPCRDLAHQLRWPTWRRRHQHRARQTHQRWNAYTDATP